MFRRQRVDVGAVVIWINGVAPLPGNDINQRMKFGIP
jgi:hypothetical protein